MDRNAITDKGRDPDALLTSTTWMWPANEIHAMSGAFRLRLGVCTIAVGSVVQANGWSTLSNAFVHGANYAQTHVRLLPPRETRGHDD